MLLSCPTLCHPTPWTAACQAPLSATVSWSLLKFVSIELVMLSNHLVLCCLILLLPSIFPSIRVFSNESALYIRWSKYWSFSISPSNEYSQLISFRNDWFDLLQSKGPLRVFSSTTIQKQKWLYYFAFSHQQWMSVPHPGSICWQCSRFWPF